MKKRIITATLCAVMLLFSVLSLSSCLYALGELVDMLPSQGQLPNQDPSQDKQPGGNNGSSSNGTGNSGTGSTVDSDTGNGGSVFYPGLDGQDEAIANATPQTKALLSIVTITSNFRKYSASDFGYSSGNDIKEYSSEGSGVIYKLDKEAGNAYVITNFHVVYNKNSITADQISDDINLYLYGQESEAYAIPATYVGGSMTNDIAVLKVEGSEVLKRSCAVAATIGDSESLSVMDPVIAIGNPEAAGISATAGIVSVESETLVMVGADGYTTISPRVIRVSAAINEGNSGGGLFSEDGKLVGIVNAKKTGSEIDNIAYAIPINVAAAIAENILYYCTETDKALYKCMLGVTLTANVSGLVIDPESGKAVKVEYVKVDSLTETCITGTQLQTGDIINSVTIDGVSREVTRLHHVIDHMYLARAGSTVTLNITRGEQTIDVTVTIPESAITLIK